LEANVRDGDRTGEVIAWRACEQCCCWVRRMPR